ncbi:MAG: hypothetical protein ACO1O6_07545 [Bacteroidota bacterium]
MLDNHSFRTTTADNIAIAIGLKLLHDRKIKAFADYFIRMHALEARQANAFEEFAANVKTASPQQLQKYLDEIADFSTRAKCMLIAKIARENRIPAEWDHMIRGVLFVTEKPAFI